MNRMHMLKHHLLPSDIHNHIVKSIVFLLLYCCHQFFQISLEDHYTVRLSIKRIVAFAIFMVSDSWKLGQKDETRMLFVKPQ